MKKMIGIVGFGNMGQALARGLIRSEAVQPQNILVGVRRETTLHGACADLSVEGTLDLSRIGANCETVFLCVKSKQVGQVVKDLGEHGNDVRQQTLVSMCAGVPLASLQANIKEGICLIKAIANINIQTGDGLTVFFSEGQPNEKTQAVKMLLEKLGVVIETETETECDKASTISATIPAMIAMTLSALVDAGIYCGVPKDSSYAIATQVMYGTAKSMQTLGLHPDVYRHMVTSPGGVVIEGIKVLESNKIRSAFIEALAAVDTLVAGKGQ